MQNITPHHDISDLNPDSNTDYSDEDFQSLIECYECEDYSME